jgi:DNA-binding transcriptional LysR family regulator
MVSAAVLPGMVQSLLAHLPDLALTVQTDRPHLLVEQLTDGRYDFLVAPTWQDRPPPGIERQLLFRDTLGIYCGAGHALEGRQGLQPRDLDGARWIGLGSGSPFDQDVRDLLQAAGSQPPRVDVVFLGEPVVLLDTLAQGAHLAVLPRFVLGQLAARFGLVELPLPWLPAIPRSMYLWSRAATLEDPAMQQVARLLQDEARRLQPRDT